MTVSRAAVVLFVAVMPVVLLALDRALWSRRVARVRAKVVALLEASRGAVPGATVAAHAGHGRSATLMRALGELSAAGVIASATVTDPESGCVVVWWLTSRGRAQT